MESRDHEATSQIASDFVLEWLADLRASHFHPVAWARFLRASWQRSRATARAHPRLVASWRRTAAALAVAEALVVLGEDWRGDRAARWCVASGAAILFGWQQFDVYAHLGLNNSARNAPLRADLGLPNTLTLARHAVAGLLWAHLWRGRPVARSAGVAALLFASATDVADGMLARWTDRETRLGQYLDSAADLNVALALACTLGSQRRLPRWLIAALALRWGLPVAYTSASYFAWVARVPLDSTMVGKAAGLAQTLTLGAALLDVPPFPGWPAARRLLHLTTVALLLATPLSQWRTLNRTGKRTGARANVGVASQQSHV